MERSCTNCASKSSRSWIRKSSWISALFVIIIPKCPFCVMAYTSAITICGGTDMYFSENNWISYIPVLLAASIIIFIMLNHRGIRTRLAMLVTMAGFILIVLTHQLLISPVFYNLGAGLLFTAIWMNGSFLSFISSLEAYLMRNLSSWPR